MAANKRRQPSFVHRGTQAGDARSLHRFSPPHSRVATLTDAILLGLLPIVAFLLACVELADPDVWWHLAGGQWILEHGKAPGLDPFTFGSANQRWIDLHWLYEVILTWAYHVGGVGALILLTATLAGGAMLAALATRRPSWPVVAIVACWLPSLVLLGFRLDPRPEMFSLLYLGCFLAVLSRVVERPAWIWMLPPVQLLWVNMHGLFILGPLLLGLFLLAEGSEVAWRWLSGSLRWDAARTRFWRHVGAASAVLVGVCLLNPYFVDGAMFPLELFPKVADADNPYKQTIEEFASPRDYLVAKYAADPVAAPHWSFLALNFLLLLLPLSFLIPAVWRASQEADVQWPLRTADAWFALVWLLAAAMAGHVASPLLLRPTPWIAPPLAWLPLPVALIGIVAAYRLRESRPTAILILSGSLAQALWMAWLRFVLLTGDNGLLGGSDSLSLLIVPLSLVVLVASGLMLRWRANLFRMLVAAAFAWLGLQAIRNWNLVALVAGTILAWNFGEWGAEVLARRPSVEPRRAVHHGLRAAAMLMLGVWITALLTDQYHGRTGEPRRFGFREAPLEFAHRAARFAGQSGLPNRALVLPLGQAGVYEFHNAPRFKPFIDGRLETPTRDTFETYLAANAFLRPGDSRWEAIIAGMGQPLILIWHRNQFLAEAALLGHRDWRCIYFDAVASVFVHRSHGVSQEDFPTVDFGERHFDRPPRSSIPEVAGEAAAELEALFNVATALAQPSQADSTLQTSLLLVALDRADIALSRDVQRAETWLALAGCCWYLHPRWQAKIDLTSPWSTEQDLYWSRTTYYLRRALDCEPRHRAAWRMLYNAFAVRGQGDAMADVGRSWLAVDPYMPADQRREIDDLYLRYADSQLATSDASDDPARVMRLLHSNEPLSAVRLAKQTGLSTANNLTWSVADPLAKACMHLGHPADAERLWTSARDCPSESLRRARLAAVSFTRRDIGTAIELSHAAADGATSTGDAWAMLTLLYAEQGDGPGTIEACQKALEGSTNDQALRRHLLTLQKLAETAD